MSSLFESLSLRCSRLLSTCPITKSLSAADLFAYRLAPAPFHPMGTICFPSRYGDMSLCQLGLRFPLIHLLLVVFLLLPFEIPLDWPTLNSWLCWHIILYSSLILFLFSTFRQIYGRQTTRSASLKNQVVPSWITLDILTRWRPTISVSFRATEALWLEAEITLNDP